MTPEERLRASEWSNDHQCIVAIGADGNVCAVNPGFSRNNPGTAVLGLSEADFIRVLIGVQVSERRRVETNVGGLRAIYHFRCDGCYTAYAGYETRHTLVAESLREPLVAVVGFVDLLSSKNYDEQTRLKLMHIMLEQVAIMSNLIHEQLDNHKWETAARSEEACS